MRILAVADTTENWPDDIEDVARTVEVILSLGDIYRIDLERLKPSGTPVIGVYGNHCMRGYLRHPSVGGFDLSRNGICAVNQSPVGTVLGVSGCVRYSNASYHQWTQEEYSAALRDMPAARVVATHCPPLGCNDHDDPAHYGIDALAEYVREHRPEHLFHGHTYPEDPMTVFGDTKIHYVRGWSVVDI